MISRPSWTISAFPRPQWRNRLYSEYEYVRGLRTENLKYIERTKEEIAMALAGVPRVA